MTHEQKTEVLGRLVGYISAGYSVEYAYGKMFGDGAYEAMVSELYDLLRAKAAQ